MGAGRARSSRFLPGVSFEGPTDAAARVGAVVAPSVRPMGCAIIHRLSRLGTAPRL